MEEDRFDLSEHGVLRARQRLGLPKKAVDREIARALSRGVKREDLVGSVRKFLDSLYHRHGHYGDYRVWREFVFVFKNERFVTVFHLPDGYKKKRIT